MTLGWRARVGVSCLLLVLCAARHGAAATISGRVTDADTGAPLQASVTITGLADEFVIGPVTDANGNYSWPSLAPGTYFVTAAKTGYLTETYGSTCYRSWCRASNGTPIVIGNAGQVVGGIDIALGRGGSIAGSVSAAISIAASGVSVRAYTTAGEYVSTTLTDSAGHYELGSLRAGSYYVLFEPSYGSYERRAYGGVRCAPTCPLRSAQSVSVIKGAVTSGIDITLSAAAGSISGSLGNSAGGFVAVRARERSTGVERVSVGSGSSSYTITGLPPGSYSVWVDMAPAGRLRPVYGGGVLTCAFGQPQCDAQKASGTAVIVGPDVAVTGIDIVLPAAGAISGEVRRSSDNQRVTGGVTLVTAANVVVASVNAIDGLFTIDQLPAGRYYAWASAPVLSLGAQIYSGASCAVTPCSPLTGTPIDVTAGTTTTGVNFDLPPATTGTVTGSVRDSSGAPLQFILVQLWNRAESLPYFGTVNSSGAFSFSAPPGTYYVRTDARYGNHIEYVDKWHGNYCLGCGPDKGTPIVVTAGQTTGPIDFVLSRGATIRGTIRKPALSSPIRIEAYSGSGPTKELVRFVECTFVTECAYTIAGLADGYYHLIARDSSFTPHLAIVIDQLYPRTDCVNRDCLQQLNPSGVTTSRLTPAVNVDFQLRLGGRIRGRAVASDLPVQTFGVTGFGVELVDGRGRAVGRASNYFDQFQIAGLPTGTYYVRTTNGQSLGYRDEVYDNIPCAGCPIEGGTPIRVVEGEIVSGIEILLDPAGALHGTVVDAASDVPLENVSVNVYSSAGTPIGTATTGPTGQWRVGGLGAGDYFVATSNSRLYVDVVYGAGPCAPCDVTRGERVTLHAASSPAPLRIALERGGALAGTVRDESGVGLTGVPVIVSSAGGVVLARAVSDTSGRYGAVLQLGTVTVQTGPYARRTPQTFPEAIQITAGSLRAGIDFTVPSCIGFGLLPMLPQLRYINSAGSVIVTPLGLDHPYRFSLLSGSLPRGWTLDETLGSAGGVATATGRFTYTVGIVGASGCSHSQVVEVSIEGCRPAIDADEIGMPRQAGTRTITVGGTCPVDVFSGQTWISVSTDLLSAPGSFVITTATNDGQTREGSVRIGNRVLRVVQAGVTSTAPFGAVDAPLDGAVVNGSIAIGGWALDDVGIERIRVVRDPVGTEPAGQVVYIGDAVRVRGARPDVDLAYPTWPGHERGGWGYLLLTNMLPNQGNGTFRLHVLASDAEGHDVLLGSRTIVANNRDATPPFGAIDTPAQGETVSGASYINFGWALTPFPKTIPTDGSTIWVVIDGVRIGNVTYNNRRQDVADLFPGLNNTAGAIGYRAIDTTQLADGVHTIAWGVTDDQGHAQGIGSRYFTVANGAALRVAPDASAHSASARSSAVREIRARELGRVVFDAAIEGCTALEGFEIVGGERRPLPVGSSFDPATGRFSWQLGPGFLGAYDLLFTAPHCSAEPRAFRIIIER
jgi:hypothetical protein